MSDSLFRKIEDRTGVEMEEIMALANAIQYADFTDERQVRKIIRKVGRVAGKRVTPHMEDQLAHSILQSGRGLNFQDIENMMR